MRIAKNKNRLKIISSVLATAVLATGGYLSYAYTTKNTWPFESNQQGYSGASPTINYSPPTEQEIENSQDAKKNNSRQDSNSPEYQNAGSDALQQAVSVGIAFAGYDSDTKAIDVRAFTPDVIEGDGICTASFRQGAVVVAESSKAFIDSSSSQCEPILVPSSRFVSKGSWELVVSYTSSKSTGSSHSVDIEVE